MVRPAWRVDLGRISYEEAWDLQKRLVERRARGEIPDVLLLLEHDPVVTLGRSVRGQRSVPPGLPTFEVERGGDLTYHGPGQLVGYPILRLEEGRRDLHRYLRDLEEVLLRSLARFGIAAERRAGYTGVWSEGRKVASIGVAVRRWVTYHGFALNVSTDLSVFRLLNPCGLPGEVMTSMTELAGRPISLAAVADSAAAELSGVFELDLLAVKAAGL